MACIKTTSLLVCVTVLMTLALVADCVPALQAIGAAPNGNGNPSSSSVEVPVEELTFIEDDPNCNGICTDTEPKPLCVALNTDRRIRKTVYNECILKRVNCHYENSYTKILDRACPK